MSIIGSGVAANADPLSLLEIVSYFCQRQGLRRPTVVMDSTDSQIIQIRALLEEEGTDLSARGTWEGLLYEATHTTIAQADQGAIGEIAPNGFRYIVNQTIFDRTQQRSIWGPLSPQEYQARQALTAMGPYSQFRIRGGKLLIDPVPTAGLTWAFEYVSENWILDGDSRDGKHYFTKDTDVTVLPSSLLLMGLRWRWLAAKGLEYAELFRSYEAQVKDALSRDGGKPILHMGGPNRTIRPGIVVPEGNWDL